MPTVQIREVYTSQTVETSFNKESHDYSSLWVVSLVAS